MFSFWFYCLSGLFSKPHKVSMTENRPSLRGAQRRGNPFFFAALPGKRIATTSVATLVSQ